MHEIRFNGYWCTENYQNILFGPDHIFKIGGSVHLKLIHELPRKIQHILLKTGETMKITISNNKRNDDNQSIMFIYQFKLCI